MPVLFDPLAQLRGESTIEHCAYTLIVRRRLRVIDRSARDNALSILRSIDSGLTNWQLEDEWPESKTDPGLGCILRWLWSLYDDDREVKIGSTFSPEDKEILHRVRQFLTSEVEFELLDLSKSEQKQVIREWGREWNPCCSGPEYPLWPFPRNYQPPT